MYEQTTRGICVSVQPSYLETHSAPEDRRFVWAYSIRIENNGPQPVRLMTRHWQITDARGETQEVDGDGVVGEQPVIDPGSSFEYTSGAPLATPSGFMVGSYCMETETGESIVVAIPAFSLDSPHHETPIH